MKFHPAVALIFALFLSFAGCKGVKEITLSTDNRVYEETRGFFLEGRWDLGQYKLDHHNDFPFDASDAKGIIFGEASQLFPDDRDIFRGQYWIMEDSYTSDQVVDRGHYQFSVKSPNDIGLISDKHADEIGATLIHKMSRCEIHVEIQFRPVNSEWILDWFEDDVPGKIQFKLTRNTEPAKRQLMHGGSSECLEKSFYDPKKHGETETDQIVFNQDHRFNLLREVDQFSLDQEVMIPDEVLAEVETKFYEMSNRHPYKLMISPNHTATVQGFSDDKLRAWIEIALLKVDDEGDTSPSKYSISVMSDLDVLFPVKDPADD